MTISSLTAVFLSPLQRAGSCHDKVEGRTTRSAVRSMRLLLNSCTVGSRCSGCLVRAADAPRCVLATGAGRLGGRSILLGWSTHN